VISIQKQLLVPLYPGQFWWHYAKICDFDPKIQLLELRMAATMKIASNITFLWGFCICAKTIKITINALLIPQKDVSHINIGNFEPKVDL
jgi:hypothetical protein